MRFFTETPASRRARRLLACGASTLALTLAATPAMAQDRAQSESEEIAEEAAEDSETSILVTGSRLAIPSGMETATPVTAIDEEEIDNLDPGALIQAMNTLPIFVNNDSPNSNAGFFARSGTGNLNLRGLGTNRTLTLLNGRRIAPSTAFGGADINLIPSAMLRGVENVTGGASAAYGTDAVAGVTNFLLDTNFTGIELNLQGGITERGDGENYEASLSFGTPFAGGRGHLLMSGEVNSMEPIFTYEGRDWYRAYGLLDSNGDGIDEVWPDVRSSRVSFDGIISGPAGFAFNNFQFDGAGGVSPYQLGVASDGAIGAIDARTSGGNGDDINCGEVCNVWPDTDRYSLFGYADFEVTPNLLVFAQYMRGHSHLFENATPRGSGVGFPTTFTIFRDNFFLNRDYPQIAAAMANQNVGSFVLRKMCSIEDCGNLYYEEWTTQDIGTAGLNYTFDTGGFLDGWKADAYYQYGRSKKVWDQFGLRVDRIFAALDAVNDGTGKPVCRVTLFGSTDFPGCQPVNLFGAGGGGSPTPDGYDYVTGADPGVQITTPLFFADSGFSLGITDSYTSTNAKRAITTFKQKFAEVSLAGQVFDLPAGPISLAFGGSYRKDSIYQINRDPTNLSSNHETGHPVLCNGQSPGLRGVSGGDCANTVGFQYSKTSNIQGAADVWEAFGETLIPLFDTGHGQRANLNLAARWADYQGSGEIWSYKGSLDFSLIDDLRLRGTYSRDVRAANLNERFNKTGGIGTVVDPRISQADIAACQAANPPPTSVNCTNSYAVTTFSGGNPNVAPEEADTYTAGVVFQPSFFPGFQMSVDWFSVDLQGAIGQVGLAEVARRCYEDSDPLFCGLITESTTEVTPAGGYPLIILAGDQYVNVAQSYVEGIDAEIGYQTPVRFFGGDENLSARLFGTYLIERSNTGAVTGANPDPQPVHFEGFGAFPKFRGTGFLSYNNGPFNINFTGRYFEGTRIQNPATAGAAGITVENNKIPATFYLDTRLNYDFEIAGTEAQVYLAITNLLDKDPPIVATYSFFTANATQTFPALHDVLGRRYTLGLRVKM